jgi:predicted outer membrane repeat protein
MWGGTFINNVAGGNGGGVNVNNNVSVLLTTFTTNTSGDLGGGILQWNPGKTVTIQSATFTGNTAKNAGGAVNVKSHATISYTKFTSNTVNAGTGTTAYGGGLYADGGADITYGKFIDNQALCNTCSLAMGGGIYTGGVLNGTNILFARNAARFGSAINFTSSTGWLNHVTIGQPTVGNYSALRINSGSNLTMYNTIISNYETGVYNQGTFTEGYNLWYGNSFNILNDGGTVNAIGHDVTGKDPLFISPATDDFHIKAFSPAIGAGIVTSTPVLYDLDVKERINRWDIGAYQFWTKFYLPLIIR